MYPGISGQSNPGTLEQMTPELAFRDTQQGDSMGRIETQRLE
jgi:hypothetical protein